MASVSISMHKFYLRKPVKHHQMLTVRRAREEVVASVVGNAIVRGKKRHVACLRDRVATEIEDALWRAARSLAITSA